MFLTCNHIPLDSRQSHFPVQFCLPHLQTRQLLALVDGLPSILIGLLVIFHHVL